LKGRRFWTKAAENRPKKNIYEKHLFSHKNNHLPKQISSKSFLQLNIKAVVSFKFGSEFCTDSFAMIFEKF
jgi:hypothetical protein